MYAVSLNYSLNRLLLLSKTFIIYTVPPFSVFGALPGLFVALGCFVVVGMDVPLFVVVGMDVASSFRTLFTPFLPLLPLLPSPPFRTISRFHYSYHFYHFYHFYYC